VGRTNQGGAAITGASTQGEEKCAAHLFLGDDNEAQCPNVNN